MRTYRAQHGLQKNAHLRCIVRGMDAKVRVPRTGIAFGGWKGRMQVEGDAIHVVGDDPANRLDIDPAQVMRCSFNPRNGLWAFRLKDERKFYLQVSGQILSADRTPTGRAANEWIHDLLVKHEVLVYSA